jgi:hypothetical protein
MEIPFNEEICNLTKNLKPFTFGYKTSIYRILDDKIVKVIYFKTKDLNIKNSIEYFISEKIKNIDELRELTVPYYGGSLCPSKENNEIVEIHLVYKYINYSTIEKQFENLKIDDYIFIFEELERIVHKFNSYGICHNDLHWGNIFYDKKNKKLLLTDWEKGSFDDKKENIEHWKNIIKNQLIINSIFKYEKFNNIKNILKKYKTTEELKGIKLGDNLYQSYINRYNMYMKKFIKQSNKNPNMNIDEALNRAIKDIIGGFYFREPLFRNHINKIVKIDKNIKKYLKIEN